MRDLVIRFYNQKIYKDEDLPIFVRVGWISANDYKELTGKNYVAED